MKLENTIANKEKFFALYWGQKVAKKLGSINLDVAYVMYHCNVEDYYLELKDLRNMNYFISSQVTTPFIEYLLPSIVASVENVVLSASVEIPIIAILHNATVPIVSIGCSFSISTAIFSFCSLVNFSMQQK